MPSVIFGEYRVTIMKKLSSPRQMKVRGVVRVRSLARQDAVNRPLWARRRRLIAKDGINADFEGAKICPTVDACRSSNRTLLGTYIVFHILKI